MPRRRLEGDPSDWSAVSRMTLICILPNGEVAFCPDGSLPSDLLADGEHPLDACLRIPMDRAGFRYQHFHPFALDQHLYGWVEGDRYRSAVVEPFVGLPAGAEDAVLVRDALDDHQAISADAYFRENVRTLERAYLSTDDVRRESGFGGDEDAWRARRLQVADCIDRDGSFLDVGCANGYLAESVVRWCAERNLAVEPYGIDLAPRLIELAQRRLPAWADRFWVGNAIDWVHPHGQRFDFVHVIFDAVPERMRGDLVRHHLESTIAPGGRLLVSHYSAAAGSRMDLALGAFGFAASGWSPTHDPARPSAGTAWIHNP